MSSWLSVDFTGRPFVLFGPDHLIALGWVALAFLPMMAPRRLWGDRAKRMFRFGLAACLLFSEIARHAWFTAHGLWTAQSMLPFHMCSVSAWLSVIALATRSRAAYDPLYFLGLGGAPQGLITPAIAEYGFPHFLALQTMITHAGIMLAVVYLTRIEGFRPTLRSLRNVILWITAALPAIFLLNRAIGGNYLFLSHKPEHPSLLDWMPAWPGYIVVMATAALAVAGVLYLPFLIADTVAGRRNRLARSTGLGLMILAAAAKPTAVEPADGLEFIDTSFDNASPAWYETDTNGVVCIHLAYDHERASPNRAAGHIHLLLHARPGSRLTLEFRNLANVYNGRPGSAAASMKTLVVSETGRDWTPVVTQLLPTTRVQVVLDMPGPRLYVARIEPYRISDLNRFLDSIRPNSLVNIETIGTTAGGRDLEIVRIGRSDAPLRVFLRARSHPWESGGNWVVQGLIRRLLSGDPAANNLLAHCGVWILPMANKDGVARGMTRFNLRGEDLNRKWDQPANPALAPENAALERWLADMTRAGRTPHLALDLHNDAQGKLHISRPDVPDLERHLDCMNRLEALLRKHTWFTEGSTTASFRNPGSLGPGWVERFGIDAAILELNCNWIAGLDAHPSGRRWELFGAGLVEVFEDYFAVPAGDASVR